MNRARLFVASIVVAFATTASAGEPTDAEKNRAAELVYAGDEKRAAGDHAAALRAYEEAHAIVQVPTTGIEVARELAALGRLVGARETAARVAEHPERDGEAAAFARARRDAKQLAASLDTRIATLVVRAPGAAGAELAVDGRIFAPGESVHLDPGKRVLTARAGSRSAKRVLHLREGEKRELNIDLSGADDAAAPAPPTGPPPAPPRDRGGSDAPLRPWVWVGFAIGGTGAAVGAVTGVVALNHDCTGGRCEAGPVRDEGLAIAHVSTVSFAIGAVGLGVGLVGLLVSGTSARAGTGRSSALGAASPTLSSIPF